MTLAVVSRRMAPALACLLAFTVSACEPEATPLPAFVPSEAVEAAVMTATPAPVRYALSPEAAAFADAILAANPNAELTVLDEPPRTEAILAHYDIVAGLGVSSGWQQSPTTPTVSLALATSRPPLNNEAIAQAVRASIDATTLVEATGIPGLEPLSIENADRVGLRQTLANAGWPDGFDLALAHANTPAVNEIAATLRAIGLDITPVELPPEAIQPALTEGRVNLALLVWTEPPERDLLASDATTVIDLFTMPIRYLAAEGVQVSFSEDGWPIVTPMPRS